MPPASTLPRREKQVGRPPAWLPLLRAFLEGQALKFGPYKSAHCAMVTASNFNRQMRQHAPEAYSAMIRFRARGVYVKVKRIPV